MIEFVFQRIYGSVEDGFMGRVGSRMEDQLNCYFLKIQVKDQKSRVKTTGMKKKD